MGIETWETVTAEELAPLKSLVSLFPEADMVRHLVLTLPEPAREAGDIALWMDSMVAVLRQADELGLQSGYEKGILIRPAVLYTAAAHLGEIDPSGDYWALVKSESELDIATETLTTSVSDGQFADESVRAIQVLSKTVLNLDWSEITRSMLSRLQSEPPIGHQESRPLITALWHLRELDQAQGGARLDEMIAAGGHGLHHMWMAHSESDYDTATKILLIYLTKAPLAPALPGFGESSHGHELVQRLFDSPDDLRDFVLAYASLLKTERRLYHLFDLEAANPAAGPFVRRCLQEFATGETVIDALSAGETLRKCLKRAT